MAKKKQEIKLEGLDDLNFNIEPDIKSAQSVVPKKELAPKPKLQPKAKVTAAPKKAVKAKENVRKGTFAPKNKKRATFNIDADLHKALKDYSYFEDIEMVEYVFGVLVKNDLAEKGYYPPKKRRSK